MDAALLTIRGEEARLMNTKRLAIMFFGVTLVLGMAGQAQALPMVYQVTGAFGDTSQISGTLTVDSNTFLNLNPVRAYNLTTETVGTFLGFTYTTSNSNLTSFFNNTTGRTTINIGSFFNPSRSLTLSGYMPSHLTKVSSWTSVLGMRTDYPADILDFPVRFHA